ncbi:acetyl-CoA carboxylase [Paucilactobacillus nenjiangensis]|jgi:hypothetical protein|uniref:Acetyl-CoA carboxylase n=1 Tax=Paucilactobacillus nenjiangensis TaxID=1296540 RepID=A0A5P1X4L8_9LACO|nr:acetyl-CoA carboxylase [Paucilactobacillus nenjiangensis]QER67228.1 acetyl-CoA carboxylase [Paucilactobacillus nenjiangensis]
MEETVLTKKVEEDSEIILTRLKVLFKPKSQHRYHIDVVNNIYGKSYNFFFDVYHDKKRERSYPLHSIFNYKIEYLEQVLKLVKQETNLSMAFRGFEGQKWTSGKLIQRKDTHDSQSKG